MIDWYARGCSMPEKASELDAWKPGDLNKMFERIVADYLNVNIISHPSTIEAEDGPWVLTIDNFLSDEDCAHLIAWGHRLGYERSPNDDGTDVNSVNEGRTSSHTWCEMQCHDDPKTMAILQRIEALTGISDLYSEDLQLLRYEPGQHYEDHHDYIDYELHRPQGVRILTVFMYLNDVEAGGGTKFTRLGSDGITVTPKKGSVLIWPSVLNDDPHSWDARTHHEALTLGAGIKFGANAWFHMRDFKTPMHGDCHFFY
jgi:prolyl 4-hydroxylase